MFVKKKYVKMFNIYSSIIVLPNSIKPIAASTDKDSTNTGVVNTVAGAAAPPSTASPSHSLSPENVIILIKRLFTYNRVKKI